MDDGDHNCSGGRRQLRRLRDDGHRRSRPSHVQLHALRSDRRAARQDQALQLLGLHVPAAALLDQQLDRRGQYHPRQLRVGAGRFGATRRRDPVPRRQRRDDAHGTGVGDRRGRPRHARQEQVGRLGRVHSPPGRRPRHLRHPSRVLPPGGASARRRRPLDQGLPGRRRRAVFRCPVVDEPGRPDGRRSLRRRPRRQPDLRRGQPRVGPGDEPQQSRVGQRLRAVLLGRPVAGPTGVELAAHPRNPWTPEPGRADQRPRQLHRRCALRGMDAERVARAPMPAGDRLRERRPEGQREPHASRLPVRRAVGERHRPAQRPHHQRERGFETPSVGRHDVAVQGPDRVEVVSCGRTDARVSPACSRPASRGRAARRRDHSGGRKEGPARYERVGARVRPIRLDEPAAHGRRALGRRDQGPRARRAEALHGDAGHHRARVGQARLGVLPPRGAKGIRNRNRGLHRCGRHRVTAELAVLGSFMACAPSPQYRCVRGVLGVHARRAIGWAEHSAVVNVCSLSRGRCIHALPGYASRSCHQRRAHA